ncbi:DUF397 domain-containing protein [Streptomyces sp. WSLK1-5]|uniref:DUF397 domain-containing protein n=1 Tax=unclassified Streptomyces TaxID=2593676 RepID=UPI00379B574C
MTDIQPADSRIWRKSSYSDMNGDCVEMALTESVLIRDSKTNLAGIIECSSDAWNVFLEAAIRPIRGACD